MADTNHGHAAPPVEGDGVSYSGIVWFVIVLVGTTVACQLFVWGLYAVMEWRINRIEPVRSALAAPVGKPGIDPQGRVMNAGASGSAIHLNVTEPLVLHEFRASEKAKLEHYAWIDKGAETVTLPIERAKELILERGLPARASATPATAALAPAKPAAEATKR